MDPILISNIVGGITAMMRFIALSFVAIFIYKFLSKPILRTVRRQGKPSKRDKFLALIFSFLLTLLIENFINNVLPYRNSISGIIGYFIIIVGFYYYFDYDDLSKF